MICSLKALSTAVHNEDADQAAALCLPTIDHDDDAACTTFTVWSKSLILNCTGFTVIDSDGKLVYRVDNYNGPLHEIILMDGLGNSILTLLRRKQKLIRLLDNWDIYQGEVSLKPSDKKKPICCMRKQLNILRTSDKVIAHVHLGPSDKGRSAYIVEGSYAHRSCKILDHESRRVVAEIKKKEGLKVGSSSYGVSYGLEVFHLIIHPGFNPAFAMAIVLLLDQMFS